MKPNELEEITEVCVQIATRAWRRAMNGVYNSSSDANTEAIGRLSAVLLQKALGDKAIEINVKSPKGDDT